MPTLQIIPYFVFILAEDNDEVSDDDSSDSFFSHFRGYVYAVRIFDIPKGGELIYTLPISSSIFSMVRVPVQWLAPSPSDSQAYGCRALLGGSEKLFFKYVPKPDCIEEVQLGVWDSSTQETSTVKSVRLFASSDLLNITYSRVNILTPNSICYIQIIDTITDSNFDSLVFNFR